MSAKPPRPPPVGNEKPSTLEALDTAIVKLANHLVQKINMIVARGPISPLTGLQSQQIRAEVGFAMRLVSAAARWFEHHKRADRSVEAGPWGDDEPTIKTRRTRTDEGASDGRK